MAAGGDAEAAIKENDRKEAAGQRAKRETERLKLLARRADVVGGGEQQAAEHDRQDRARAATSSIAAAPGHGRQENQPEQQFLVNARPRNAKASLNLSRRLSAAERSTAHATPWHM